MPVMRLVRDLDNAGAAAHVVGRGEPMPFVAVTGGVKGDGIDTADLPWSFARGEAMDGGWHRFPLLWVHDFGGQRLPLGVTDVRVREDGVTVEARAIFDPEDEFAVAVERKYVSEVGGLRGFSASWDDVDARGVPARATGAKPVAHGLLEVSAVPVGMDPDAIKDGRVAALRALARDLLTALEVDATEDGATDGDGAGARGRDDCTDDCTDAGACACEGDAGDGDAGAARARAKRAIAGSWEHRIDMVARAAREQGIFPGARWVWPHSTTADSALFCVSMEDAVGADHYWLVGYKVVGEVVEFQLPATEVQLQITETIQSRGIGDAGAEDEDAGDAVAAEMVAVFDPASDDSDAARSRRYRALLPAYRRLGWTAPELLPVAELRALDADVWRGLFVSGELDRTERAGKEISAANLAGLKDALAQLEAGCESLRAMVTRVDSGADRAAEPTPDDIARAIMDSMRLRVGG